MRKRYSTMLVGAGLLVLAGTAAAAPSQLGFGIYFAAPAPVYSSPHAREVRYAPPVHAAPPVYVEPAHVQHGSARVARYEGHGAYDRGSQESWSWQGGH